MTDYPIELEGSKHDITVTDERTARIGCNEYSIPDLFTTWQGGPKLKLSSLAHDEAREHGYDSEERGEVRGIFTTLHQQGLINVEPPEPEYETGQIIGGIEWTTNPGADVHEGDIILEGVTDSGMQNLRNGTLPGINVGSVFVAASSAQLKDGAGEVLLKVSPARDTSFPEEDAQPDNELPGWVDADKEYDLPSGKVGVPSEYRNPEKGEWYVLFSHCKRQGTPGKWRKNDAGEVETPRIILEERNVAPSYWRDHGINPDDTWDYRGQEYELKDEEPREPSEGEVWLGWSNFRGDWTYPHYSSPTLEHPKLGRKRPILTPTTNP